MTSNVQLLFSLVCGCLQFAGTRAYWTEMEFLSIENVNVSDDSPLQGNLQVKRITRSEFGISGNIWTNPQLADYDAEIAILFASKMSNNYYINTPARFPRAPMCEFLQNFYFKHIMKEMMPPVSDLPQVEVPEDICREMTNLNFTIHKFQINTDPIPKFAEPGMYKCVIKVHQREPDRLASAMEFVLRLS